MTINALLVKQIHRRGYCHPPGHPLGHPLAICPAFVLSHCFCENRFPRFAQRSDPITEAFHLPKQSIPSSTVQPHPMARRKHRTPPPL